MTTFVRHSERVPPQGAAAGDVAERALGKHGFGRWELLLRETFQNSWDARQDRERGRIDYRVELFNAGDEICALLGSEVFPDLAEVQDKLRASLTHRDLDLMVVSDSGTRGLGGPTRGDVYPAAGERTDFADFVLHIGRPTDKEVGGGTFGFGKAVFPTASRFGVCLVYSQVDVGGKLECRFIAYGIGGRYAHDGHFYTGRHWWGLRGGAASNHVEPIRGVAAQRLAKAFRMDTMGESSTGTSVAIVGPDLDIDRRAAVVEMSQAALRWIWPHLIDNGDGTGPRATVSFVVDGEPIPAPDPSSDPLVMHFARAFRDAEELLRQGQPKDSSTGWSRLVRSRGARDYGALAVQRYPSIRLTETHEHTHHIAMMRGPRLVVQYLPVKEPGPGQALGGVFIAHDNFDETFARAEPPAHDVWQPEGVVDPGKDNPVRIVLRRVAEYCAPLDPAPNDASGAGDLPGAASLARRFGSLLAGTEGAGSELLQNPQGGDSRGVRHGSSGARRWRPVVSELEWHGGLAQPEVDFLIPLPDGLPAGYSLRVAPRVVIHGGGDEKSGSDFASIPTPQFIGWFDQTGQLISTDELVEIEGLSGVTILRARLTQPELTAVRIDLKVESS